MSKWSRPPGLPPPVPLSGVWAKTLPSPTAEGGVHREGPVSKTLARRAATAARASGTKTAQAIFKNPYYEICTGGPRIHDVPPAALLVWRACHGAADRFDAFRRTQASPAADFPEGILSPGDAPAF